MIQEVDDLTYISKETGFGISDLEKIKVDVDSQKNH